MPELKNQEKQSSGYNHVLTEASPVEPVRKHSKARRVTLITVTVLLILLLIIITVATNFFYNTALKPGGFNKLVRGSSDADVSPPEDYPAYSLRTESIEWWNNVTMETMSITSNDGLALQGYYIENDNPSDKLVILAHGYAGRASGMAVFAKIYYDLGFNIFAPDNRGHGNSEGDAIGMGWLDRTDYLQWIKHLISVKGDHLEIILHGESMGGATVSILSGEDLPPNVKGIISDCAYDSVTRVFTEQLKSFFNLPAFPMIPATSLMCKLRAGYFFGDVDVIAQVEKCKIPILFIHGEDDTFVPYDMVYNLYNAADESLRDIWTVPGAEHGQSILIDTDGYIKQIEKFLERTKSQ